MNSLSASYSATSMVLSSTLRFSSAFLLRQHQYNRYSLLLTSSRRFLSVPPNPPPPRLSKDKKSDGNGTTLAAFSQDTGRVVPVELHEEMTGSYITYSMSVLLGRALPDVRDGLKPVHRRILFAMHELGLSSRKSFKKCARVVGEVLGKFHPHGDSAVYDSLVRMAQNMRLVLVLKRLKPLGRK